MGSIMWWVYLGLYVIPLIHCRQVLIELNPIGIKNMEAMTFIGSLAQHYFAVTPEEPLNVVEAQILVYLLANLYSSHSSL